MDLFVLEGALEVNDQPLSRRDGLGIWQTDEITIRTLSPSGVLLMDLPMAV